MITLYRDHGSMYRDLGNDEQTQFGIYFGWKQDQHKNNRKMGKPKALRNRDVAPAISKDQSAKKRTVFSESDTHNPEEENSHMQTKLVDDSADDIPEEVSADNAEILRLKELHERLTETNSRLLKKRKVVHDQRNSKNADKELDVSIFESMETIDDEEVEEESDEDGTTWKIDVKKSNSRKIGGVEVAVLNHKVQLDPLTSFTVTESAMEFSASSLSKNPRVKYSTFMSQKKGGPAKQFAVKC